MAGNALSEGSSGSKDELPSFSEMVSFVAQKVPAVDASHNIVRCNLVEKGFCSEVFSVYT